MGLIIAKFRKKKTTIDELEIIDKEIQSIEDYRRNTEQTHKKIVGQFLVFSIAIYVLSAVLLYFYIFPSTKSIKTRVIYIIPLILAPVIIFTLKKVLTWYYNRKISKNQNKLVSLKDEKKKMVEKVMETETYKVARAILEKYAPEQVRKVNLSSTELTPMKGPLNPGAHTGLRQRQLLLQPGTKSSRVSFGNLNQTPSRTLAIAGAQSPQNMSPGGQPFPGTPLPRAILPRERSVLDRMVEYLVGDGPTNRFALICRNCSSHNGMALKEEFEYISYRCCYCFTFNPARKKRPAAPKLEFDASTPLSIRSPDTSESEKNSGTDTERETESDSETKKTEPLVETLYSNVAEVKNSDNERGSDFDKLSDLETKGSDSEPMEIDENAQLSDGKIDVA